MILCVHTVVTHPCDIPPLAQACPMMLCQLTEKHTYMGVFGAYQHSYG